jgi:hypothetical protein
MNMKIDEMNEASSAVAIYLCNRMGAFTLSREEAEYIKKHIDGAVHDGWDRPNEMALLPSCMRE